MRPTLFENSEQLNPAFSRLNEDVVFGDGLSKQKQLASNVEQVQPLLRGSSRFGND